MAADGDTYTLRWGIMATGGIAERFCKDLLADPVARNVRDIRHEIVAVSSSTSIEKASDLVSKIKSPVTAKLYGSYSALVADTDVDIIYIATPHSHHFQNAMLALEAGKHVLCEKALTVTAAQARKLVATARCRDLFFMEAVKTRFFPASIQIRELIAAGEIGTVYRTFADMSFNENSDSSGESVSFADDHRMVNASLAGGALLDLGVYALTWVFQTLYHLQREDVKEPPVILSASNQYRTGVDETTSIICQFPGHNSMGLATTSIRVGTNPHPNATTTPAVRIQGSKGEIRISHPAGRPLSYTIIKTDGEGEAHRVNFATPVDSQRGPGHGMFWQADECARCLKAGLKESRMMPWAESVAVMEAIESALKQGGIRYPELITTDVFDPNSPLNTGVGHGR